MKKVLLILAAASMCLVACNKDDKTPSGDNQPGTEQPGEEEGNTVSISIDGTFTDWDAYTATSEDGKVYVCAEPNATYNKIKNLKAASDGELIYMYLEIDNSVIVTTDLGQRGDSWNGCGFKTPGCIYIDLDADNDDATGLFPHTIYASEENPDDLGYGWENFKMDNCIQLYIWRAATSGVVDLSWSQANPAFVPGCDFDGDGKDGAGNDATDQEMPELTGEESYSDSSVEYYFWNTKWDNYCVKYDHFKAVAGEAWTQIEFAIDPATLWVNGEAEQTITEIAFGIYYNQASTEPRVDGGEDTRGLTGVIPGDRVAATLVL